MGQPVLWVVLDIIKPIKRRPHRSKRMMKRPLLGKRGVNVLKGRGYLKFMEDDS